MKRQEDSEMAKRQSKGPVSPDVELLLQKFSVAVGTHIPYKKIEKVLGVKRKKHRWKTVVSAWRNRLEHEYVVQLICKRGKAFIVADPPGRVNISVNHTEKALRSVTRANGIARRTDPNQLGVVDNMRRDHVIRVTSTIILTATQARQKLQTELVAITKQNSIPKVPVSPKPQAIPPFPPSIQQRAAKKDKTGTDG